MDFTREDYLARLDTALQDTAEKLQPDDKERLLSQAVVIFSKDKPNTKVHEITGDGSAYDFAMPSDWVDGVSYITGEIEYPADEYQDPVYLEKVDWMFFRKLVTVLTVTSTVTYLRFRSFTPALSKKARFEYALPHTVSDSENTISNADIEAVVTLTAALCFWALAAKFTQTTDPSIEADVIDYQRKSDTYSQLAKEKISIYNSMMGLGEESKGNAPASAGVAIKDLDIAFSWSEEMLTHPSRFR
jgi:hypothetical protein